MLSLPPPSAPPLLPPPPRGSVEVAAPPSRPPARAPFVLVVLVLAAVGLAFADASVVTLALPDLYAQFDTTVVGVSWVLTTYALVVAVAAVPLAFAHRRLRPLPVTASGLGLFAVASLTAGLATNLPFLLVARGAQGVGATLLLAGSLPVLGALMGSPTRARTAWATAATVGAAVGPALGGVLTQVFAWRAIFLVQAPVAAAALAVCAVPAARALRADQRERRDRTDEARSARRRTVVANVGFALMFAALVGALFLGVLLAIEVWRYSPIAGAVVVTGVPLGMLLVRPVHGLSARTRAIGGAVCLAAGLAGLALLPGEQPIMAAAAFVLCGAGFELVSEVLSPAAIPADEPPLRTSSVSIGARHAGLVLGLVILAPVLATSIDNGIHRAVLGGTRTLLDAHINTRDKIQVAWKLRDDIESTPKGKVPDLAAVFNNAGAGNGDALATARDDLTTTINDAITRSFRPAFALAALFGALAVVPALVVAAGEGSRERSTARRRAAPLLVVLCGGVAVLLVAEVGAGARDVGEYHVANACTASPDPYPGSGLDAAVQRIALSTLNGAACELGIGREHLVLSLDRNSGYGDITWNKATTENALKKGAHRAIDDAEKRGSLPGWAGSALGFVVDHAPMSWLVEKLPFVTK